MDLHLVLCADRAVLQGLAVTVLSALEHSSAPIIVHIIENGLSSEDKDKLRRSWKHQYCSDIHFHSIDGHKISHFRSTAYLKSKSAYSRYFVEEFLDKDLDRCIYLDTDLLVLRDLADLARLNLSSAVVAAVADISSRLNSQASDVGIRLKLKDPKKYFNSGVLVLNLQKWRSMKICDRLIDYSIHNADTLHSQDQDALNVVLEEKTILIDPSWNTAQYEKPDPIDGLVVHLLGTVKPWQARYANLHEEAYYRTVIQKRFQDVLDRTEFQGRRPWNPFGIGAFLERMDQKVPTSDMVARKLRLAIGR